MKKYILATLGVVAVGIVLVVGLTVYALRSGESVSVGGEVGQDVRPATVTYGDMVINVDVADTPAKRHQGLSGRASLARGEGMLFVFAEPGLYGFWMPDMRFAIDIIWLDAKGRVVTIKENATPESYPELFYPVGDVLYVLEVPSGYARDIGLEEGSTLTLAL